jgi:group I intron endonuclease
MHYIYKITNTSDGKVYIGQTNNPTLRWSQHKSNAKYSRGQQVITRAMTKYGVDKFDFVVVACCISQADADAIETDIIIQCDSRNMDKGYNLNPGGNTSPRTPEISKKISDSLLKRYEGRDGWNKGGTLTEDWKNNISKASMGKAGTNRGKKFDDEWKVKLSKSNVGKEHISNRRFSMEQEVEICRLYVEENCSTYLLAKKFECYSSLIISILNRAGIQKRLSKNSENVKKRFIIEDEIKICEIYKEGKITISGLAKQFLCGKTIIRNILIRHSIIRE